MKKKLLGALLCLTVIGSLLVGCSDDNEKSESTDSKTTEATDTTDTTETEDTVETTDTTTYPELDLEPTVALSVAIDGTKAIAPSELSLNDEEIQKLKDGNFTAAFAYHTQSDTCNQNKLAAAEAMLEGWGVEVVSVTDANFDAATQTSDIESIMALNPDILYVMPYDADAVASALQSVQNTDTKIIFMENVATGFEAGVDYVACVSSDSYGNGKAAADIMAKELNYEGTVAMMYYDLVYYVTNERDRGFKETIEKDYPNMEIVVEEGFTDVNNTGNVADAIFAKYPDINGIYASWDVPAEGAVASANSLGRDDIVITTCDLGDTAFASIAQDGIIVGTGAPRSTDQGKGEALAGAYALLGKELPSTFITPPSLPIIKENLIQGYKDSYGEEVPSSLRDLLE